MGQKQSNRILVFGNHGTSSLRVMVLGLFGESTATRNAVCRSGEQSPGLLSERARIISIQRARVASWPDAAAPCCVIVSKLNEPTVNVSS